MGLQFRATNEQVMQLGANAVNASKPVGMGFLQYDGSKKFEPDFFREWVETYQEMNLDYVGGRMVKLYAKHKNDQVWEILNPTVNTEYQSWGELYPTYQALLKSAGIYDVENTN